LLANAICMEALPIFLDRLVSPIAAIGISVTAVLFFGEIMPQALCTRFGLAIGANLAYLVWTLIFVFLVVAWPIAKLLDWLLGHGSGRFYRRRELVELVRLHEIHDGENHEPLLADKVQLIEGAVQLTGRTVQDVLTPLERVVAVASDAEVDTALLARVIRAGHSRLPVHAPGHPGHVVGILLTKTLLHHLSMMVPGNGLSTAMDPGPPSVCVRDLPLRPVLAVLPSTALYDMLHMFETGRSHPAVVLAGASGHSMAHVAVPPVAFAGPGAALGIR
jgi:metal transporter CNNM